MTNEGMMPDEYILKRIVYVNSANHGYSEFLLDQHLAMFGGNNAGKTASLAGTKLLLYPEVSFDKCDEKFKFEGKRGAYSKEDSYEFYFPSSTSFLALEVENPFGVFCMILYKANNYKYGRFFIPRSYATIRHNFWNTELDTFAEDLSIESLEKYVYANDGIQESDPKQIAFLMYNSLGSSRSNYRFCVIPLKNGNPESINAFRNIYQLAFDTTNTETETLPEAIATLVEMQRGRAEERLDADLNKLTEQHSQLVKNGQHLQQLENAKPMFERIKTGYDQFMADLKRYSNLYRSILNALNLAKSEYAAKYNEVDTHVGLLTNTRNQLNTEINQLNKSTFMDKGAYENAEKKLNKDKHDLEQAKLFVARYAGLSIHEIRETLNHILVQTEARLSDYQEADGVKRKLENNITRQNRLKEDVVRLNQIIAKSESLVLHQLQDEFSASVLMSLNPNFGQATASLDEKDKPTVQSFTELFGKDDSGYLTFLSQSVPNTIFKPFDKDAEIARRTEEKKSVESEISALDQDIRRLHHTLKHNDLPRLIEETNREITATKNDIKKLDRLNLLQDSIPLQELELDNLLQEMNSRLAILTERNENLDKTKGELFTFQKQKDELSTQQNSFATMDTLLSESTQLCEPILSPSNEESVDQAPTLLTIDESKRVLARARECATKQNNAYSDLTGLMKQLPPPNIDPHKELTDVQAWSQVIESYRSSFTTLEYELLQHQKEIRSHNGLVSNQLNELKEAKDVLINCIHEINEDLNSKHVSNLSEIKLQLKTNTDFDTLLASLSKHDIQDETLLDDQFYKSLSLFVDKYFNKKTRRLKMKDIIHSITYRYKLAETGEELSKSQSGGTTTTITAFVLSVLLKQITKVHITLRMPIIVDEISTLDTKNIDATIKQIADHGFSIFCATPSFNAALVRKVGRWITIDQKTVQAPMVNKCHFNILPDHIQSFGVIADEA